MAADEGLQIAGYYAAAENFNENTIEKVPGARIADKIAEVMTNAVCIMVIFYFADPRSSIYQSYLWRQVDNKAMGLEMDRPAVKVWSNVDGRWVKSNFALDLCESTLEAVSSLLQKQAMKDLCDFDNYLDNVENDWLNSHLNRDLKQLLAMYWNVKLDPIPSSSVTFCSTEFKWNYQI